ncbi:hypothetical protein WMY93_018211 [Mugilogobius chulae]|uniref:RING-type domain-containing protein n=1 Tax=Mugilogobius chulae TaxID=88201 RepID=A0AAW0NTA5_9GOBI
MKVRGVESEGSCQSDMRGSSVPSSPSCTPNTPTLLYNSESNLSSPLSFSLKSNYSTAFSSSAGIRLEHLHNSELPVVQPAGVSHLPVQHMEDECTICYENVVDTVLYACGHMCLCYSCGLKLKKMSNACCPICRRTIKDIIKTYRST